VKVAVLWSGNYCTVSAIVVVWVMLPDVALIVICCTPVGVVAIEEVESEEEHPTMEIEPARKRRPNPRKSNGFLPLAVRLKDRATKEPNGIKRAVSITDATPCQKGRCWRLAMAGVV
jgi:hypothetical protein